MTARRSGTILLAGGVVAALLLVAAVGGAQNRVVEAMLRDVRVTGALTEAQVRAGFEPQKVKIERCLRAPNRVGSAELHFVIAVTQAGRIGTVTFDPAPLPRPAMRACVLRAVRAARFPSAAAASQLDIIYEINW